MSNILNFLTLPGSGVLRGTANNALVSRNGNFKLVLQDDGNLVLYNLRTVTAPMWASNTVGSDVNSLVIRQGMVKLLSPSGADVTVIENPQIDAFTSLVLGDDGNLTLLRRGVAIWNAFDTMLSYKEFDTGPLTTEKPLGGFIRLTIQRDGSYTSHGHVHNSGFDSLHYGASGVLLTPTLFALVNSATTGATEGTAAGIPLGHPNRDSEWTATGQSDHIRENWADALASRLGGVIVPYDVTLDGLQSFVGSLVQKMLQDLSSRGISEIVGGDGPSKVATPAIASLAAAAV
jgi:hypothetical protein